MSDNVNPSGPVDIAVLGFLDAEFDGSVATVVAEAVASGAVRLLDAVLVQKTGEDEVMVVDVDEETETLEVLGIPLSHAGLLGEDDIGALSEEIPVGATAVVVVWENVWAARLAAALDSVGGVMLAHERIDRGDLDAVLAALDD